MTRAVIIGAGIVGSACAEALTRRGVEVVVVDRSAVGSGTTSRGEGNILVSDKGPGTELSLAELSRRAWLEVGELIGPSLIELEEKGGLVVAQSRAGLEALARFATGQRAAGVTALDVGDPQVLEPRLAAGLPGAVHYPEDMQVQPVLAAAALLAAALERGATFRTGTDVTAAVRDGDGSLSGIRTADGQVIEADVVVNASGTWGGEVSERLGAPVPVLPRRGFVLVTEPLPPLVRHKVYSADYVDNVGSSDAGLETSCVVEGTRGGTVLIGASRERVGFDTTLSVPVVETLARQAVALFPFLARVNLLRVYRGFRPYCPDHLPVIGPDPRVPGVIHACGHEGAGIGLAAGTGRLVGDYVTGARTHESAGEWAELLPDRFAGPSEQQV
ncbi:MAG: FAD-binding oxidoreductase [Intrasporangium sp.]|uniref:NAD(P)/FAD-dependent oxidoreductase n=1 Tax=Intrasporangium sp. TaxID=1925024 RepID=UPI002648BB5E|nr:FAD-binding oxidoreductase [Intrasporangium sp.]MDN5795187.1 FAD-binding oxidoreductase [Intrasporangium sp.]